ncbi:MAG TPA: ABC transporter substrate-binding protein [Dehalococcoidia bacterium]|nr:ABC transporter substrate-binding protein [Dehalococcoidia bacterium]
MTSINTVVKQGGFMLKTRLMLLILVAVLSAGLAVACGDDDDDDEEETTTPSGTTPAGAGEDLGGESVDVLGIWGDEELASFEAMVAPWQDDTGGSVEFTGTRDITSLLTTRVEGGNPPDIAIPAEIGLFRQFAAEGELVPLSSCMGLEEQIMQNYPQSFIELGTVDGELYGFFMKADTKGTIWYDPQFFEENGYEPLSEDSTFDDLVALSDEIAAGDHGVPPWSIGNEADAGSGFPGSDWIQQILLNEAGEQTYDGVVDGSVPFTDPAVRDAFEKFGQIALTEGYVAQGGAEGINATNFQDATLLPFGDPPEAAMVYLGGFAAGFITDQFPDAVAGEDYDFFPFPGGAVTGGANIVYAFNSDPATCSVLSWLAGAESQQIWVERGGFTSVNSEVSLDTYPDEVARKQAQQLLEAPTFRFDLDDAIGGSVQQAIFNAIITYLQNPDDLDALLQNIEDARGG